MVGFEVTQAASSNKQQVSLALIMTVSLPFVLMDDCVSVV